MDNDFDWIKDVESPKFKPGTNFIRTDNNQIFTLGSLDKERGKWAIIRPKRGPFGGSYVSGSISEKELISGLKNGEFTLNESEFDWVGDIKDTDFTIGTRFRYKGDKYDDYSHDVFEIVSVQPESDIIGIKQVVKNGYPIEDDPFNAHHTSVKNVRYKEIKDNFDSGVFENESVRDDIDNMIYVGSIFEINHLDHNVKIKITDVDECGNSTYEVIESNLSDTPVGMVDELEIDTIRNFIVDGVYKNVRTNLREDFEWTESISAIELGDNFEEDDVVFEEDDDFKVNIVNGGREVIYYIEQDKIEDALGDGYWIFNYAINGPQNSYYDSDYFDGGDEGQFMYHNLNTESKLKLNEFLESLGYPPNYADKFSNEFMKLEPIFDAVEDINRYGSFDYFISECLSDLSIALDYNRQKFVHEEFNKHIKDTNLISFEEGNNRNYYRNSTYDYVIRTKFPYRDGLRDLSLTLETILEDVDYLNLYDTYYEEWDTRGSEDDIQVNLGVFIDKMENIVLEMDEDEFEEMKSRLPKYVDPN